MEKNFSFETTQFDLDFANHIKNLRKSAGLTKEELSLKMGVAKSFVGNVESHTQRHKYSTRHISLLAKAFGFKNISELMDFPTPQHDRIKVTVKQIYNGSGTKVMESEVVGIEGIE
ncbi:helix-turn-helix domain-containing protein [Chryseobacterium profundimaris]|uniref:Helix-turn-helix n=1 Tax=Chryseobacterium profundimaris TaxID=1387275 RepID=A0ABY1PBZ0_9FLAO|nr:helix-turn-helix transcriptional regulator [Chryseobacterium profundimaris]SMP31111.1 Helix-turn-helix [Chryseobacterium profundimaris]